MKPKRLYLVTAVCKDSGQREVLWNGRCLLGAAEKAMKQVVKERQGSYADFRIETR